jgi:hypothetical protein
MRSASVRQDRPSLTEKPFEGWSKEVHFETHPSCWGFQPGSISLAEIDCSIVGRPEDGLWRSLPGCGDGRSCEAAPEVPGGTAVLWAEALIFRGPCRLPPSGAYAVPIPSNSELRVGTINRLNGRFDPDLTAAVACGNYCQRCGGRCGRLRVCSHMAGCFAEVISPCWLVALCPQRDFQCHLQRMVVPPSWTSPSFPAAALTALPAQIDAATSRLLD